MAVSFGGCGVAEPKSQDETCQSAGDGLVGSGCALVVGRVTNQLGQPRYGVGAAWITTDSVRRRFVVGSGAPVDDAGRFQLRITRFDGNTMSADPDTVTGVVQGVAHLLVLDGTTYRDTTVFVRRTVQIRMGRFGATTPVIDIGTLVIEQP